jgi:hypothetical protein
MGGISSLVGAATGAGGSSGTSGLLQQLQSAEQQALQDMVAIEQNQIQFNQQMNDAQTAKNVAQGFAIHS